MSTKNVFAIVVNWNNYRDTSLCLQSLKKIKYQNLRIIVVDNGSTDSSIHRLKEEFPDFVFIRTERNLGFGGGVNFGVNYILNNYRNVDYLWILNNDVEVKEDTLTALVKTIEDKTCGTVSSLILNYDGRPQNTGKFTIFGKHFLRNHIPELAITVPYPSGVSFLISREMLVDGKLFDEDYFLYGEDVYLGWLLNIKGFENYIEPRSVLYHRGGATTKSLKNIPGLLNERNHIVNLISFFQAKTLIKILPLIFINYSVNILKLSKPHIHSVLWVIINIKKIMRKRKHIQKMRNTSDSLILRNISYMVKDENKYAETKSLTNRFKFLYCRALNKILKLYFRVVKIQFCDS